MKKKILILLFTPFLCFLSMKAQKTKANPCDSMQMLYDQALVVLDSVLGNQNELLKQMDKTQGEITRSKSEISKLVKDKNKTDAELKEARKLNAEQSKKIQALEAEVKRLSAPKSSKKKAT